MTGWSGTVKNITSKAIWRGAIAGSLLFITLFGAVLAAEEKPAFLSGKVRDLSGQSVSLDKKLESARTEFQKSGGGKIYFAAYEFLSRHKIRRGNSYGAGEGYVVSPKESKIKIEEKGRGWNQVGTETDTKDASSPAALLILYDAAKNGEILDVAILDIDQTYDFADAAVFWLGRADNTESVSFLERSFDAAKGASSLQKNVIFAAGCHQDPRAYAFLKKVAIGSDDNKIRESAIFWLGNYGDAKSLADLKDIYAKEKSDSVKKQIVFALQLSRQKEAVEELIRIAKQDASLDVRKQAVFWLGQKASAESIKALKDIVGEPGEDTKLKNQAVFAISQLPKDKSVPMLIDIAKSNKTASIRKNAIFWLGQSGDPAAVKFFEEILLKK